MTTWPYWPRPPGLLRVLEILLDSLGNGLAVGNLGLTHVGIHLELTSQAVDNDLKMQLAHSGDKCLPGLLVGLDPEGRIFLDQLLKGLPEGIPVALSLGLDGDLNDGLGKINGLKKHRTLQIAQRLTRGGLLQSDGGDDVTGVGRFDVLALVGVHLSKGGQRVPSCRMPR